jgi:hypothetical protein
MSKKENSRNWYLKNKEYANAVSREYNLNNKEKVKVYNKNWNIKNKDKVRKQILERVYNLNFEDYTKLLIEQGGCCASCNETFIKTPHVDHNHTTGKTRGLLCSECNTAYTKKYGSENEG